MKSKIYLNGLREKTEDDLKNMLVDEKKRLFELRLKKSTNQLKNTGEIKIVKRNIARILTIIAQKKMLIKN